MAEAVTVADHACSARLPRHRQHSSGRHIHAWQRAASARPRAVWASLPCDRGALVRRSEEHTSELQSLMRISYAVFCLKKKKKYDRSTKSYTRTTNMISYTNKTKVKTGLI